MFVCGFSIPHAQGVLSLLQSDIRITVRHKRINGIFLISFSLIYGINIYVIKSCIPSFRLAGNVRRYVQLAQSRGGASFCTRGALQGYDCYLFILALAKTVTPGGSPRREPGRPAPPLKVFHFDQRILAVQKPIAYTDLLGNVLFYFSLFFQFHHFNRAGSCFSFSA